MKKILAIDPGAGGGLAWTDGTGICCVPMPEGMTAQADLIRELKAQHPTLSVVMEKTGTYRPGNSGPAAAKFARHCGHLEGMLYMLGVPVSQVAPGVWMKCLGALPANKQERKRAIKEEMSRRYPHLEVTLRTADALGILTYTMKP